MGNQAQDGRYRRRKRNGQKYADADLEATPIDDLLYAVRNLRCAWCSEGPFVSPSSHWFYAHGVRAREMKQRLGLPVKMGLADPEYAERLRSENMRRGWDVELLSRVGREGRAKQNDLPLTALQQQRADVMRRRTVLDDPNA